MKVLLLCLKAFSGTGGIEKVSQILMKALSDLKGEGISKLCVLSAYDDQPNEQYVRKEDFTSFHGNRVAFSISAVRTGVSVDVVLLTHVNLAPIALLIKSLHPTVRVLLIAHGIEIWPRLGLIKRRLLHACHQILAISEFTKNQIIANNGIGSDKISILHNTLDPFFCVPTRFHKPTYLLERYRFQPEHKILLTVARLSSVEKYKGHDNVITGLGLVKREIPSVKYLLAGKYDALEKLRLDELIRTKGLQDDVILTGYVEEKELVDHFLLGDVFVMPSKMEGFGLVFLEALASGLTVIAGNQDGSTDAVRNGEWGDLVDPDDVNQIANTIVDVLNKSAALTLADKLKRSQEVQDYFGFQKYKQRLWDLMQE